MIFLIQKAVLKHKKFFEQLIKNSLRFLIAFQLVIQPYVLADQKKDQEKNPNLLVAEDFNQRVESLREFAFGNSEQEGFYKNHPLDIFSLLGQKAIRESKKKIGSRLKKKKAEELVKQEQDYKERYIRYKNVLVKVFKDSKNKELQAILSHQNQTKLAPHILDLKEVPFFSQSFFRGEKNQKYSFKLTHHNKDVNLFPQNIEWMVFFGPYLIFLEASKVSKKKALISFIDLEYFQKAIGKTSLPIFYIPIQLEKTSKELMRDVYIDKKSKELVIGEIKISSEKMQLISRSQQLNFNVAVSLLDLGGDEMSKEYLTEIINHYNEPSNVNVELAGKKVHLNQEMKDMALKLLEGLRNSSSNSKEHINAIGHLASQESNPTIEEFQKNLEVDKSFQDSVNSVYQKIRKEGWALNRFALFLNHMVRPQPLGAPKIKQALGLIANSVLKSESIKERFQVFKEVLLQNKGITASVLLGAGAIASPQIAGYYMTLFDTMGSWLGNWLDLGVISAKASFEGFSIGGLYDSYLKGDKSSHFAIGTMALTSIVSLVVATFHVLANVFAMKTKWKEKQKVHDQKVKGLWNSLWSSLKNKRRAFIDYMESSRLEFIENLANAEKGKLGLPLEFQFGFNQIKTNQILNTSSPALDIYEALKLDQLSLELKAKNQEDRIRIIKLQSEPLKTSSFFLKDDQVLISLTYSGKKIKRVFSVSDGDVKEFLEKGKAVNLEQLSFFGEEARINSSLQNVDFTAEENERIDRVLKEIKESKPSIMKLSSSMSEQEITTLRKAFFRLFFSYAPWSNTFRILGLSWNFFFFSRNLFFSPITAVRLMYYPKYFNMVNTEKHIETIFNGGKQNAMSRIMTTLKAKGETQKNFKETRESLEKFEKQILKVEKKYLKSVMSHAYLELIKQVGKTNGSVNVFSTRSKDLQSTQIKNKTLKLFFEMYTKELFKEVMKDYFFSGVENSSKSSVDLKNELFVQMLNGENVFQRKFTEEEIKRRVQKVSREHKVVERVQKSINRLKWLHSIPTFSYLTSSTSRQQISRNVLNPEKNTQMDRWNVAQRMLNEPEALTRATKQGAMELLINTPVQIAFLFLVYAGVDQGLLKVLHKDMFSDEAWFHLGRFAVWMHVAYFYVGFLAGTWMKVQMDARLDANQGFDVIPEKSDIKRMGALRFITKQFFSQDNSTWQNYKYSWQLAIANLPAAFVLILATQIPTLGRFDLDSFLNMYLLAIFPLTAWSFKSENAFEKFANWSLKDLVKKGIDFKGKDSHLLSHPKVQDFKLKRSGELRRNYNAISLVGTPIYYVLELFTLIGTKIGDIAFPRMFFLGETATEHVVNFMDYLEEKGMPSTLTEGCKKIFTNNKPGFE